MSTVGFNAGVDTVAAIATPPGEGGIAVVRVSGKDAIAIADSAWRGKSLSEVPSHSVHLGGYVSMDGDTLDECLATVFRAPSTFTGEDVVELSLHGSRWLQRAVLNDLVARGCRVADRGEFSRRAFMNGRIDLAQAEGIADLIASSSRAAHRLALSQTKGVFSSRLDALRCSLVDLASLLELELDFSEEDVEFADRARLVAIAGETSALLRRLVDSYATGSALKNGIGVVMAGCPNAGKSTLLNCILEEEKAIVSDIPGTTRDVIEDTREIDGILYRFIDTAGIRTTDDTVENIGIDRAKAQAMRASAVIWLLDVTAPLQPQIEQLADFANGFEAPVTLALNKTDLAADIERIEIEVARLVGESERLKDRITGSVRISATGGVGVERLLETVSGAIIDRENEEADLIVTNARHYESLRAGLDSMRRVESGLSGGLSADLIAQDLRETIHHIGLVTGAITTDTLLHTIFSRFCIGK